MISIGYIIVQLILPEKTNHTNHSGEFVFHWIAVSNLLNNRGSVVRVSSRVNFGYFMFRFMAVQVLLLLIICAWEFLAVNVLVCLE